MEGSYCTSRFFCFHAWHAISFCEYRLFRMHTLCYFAVNAGQWKSAVFIQTLSRGTKTCPSYVTVKTVVIAIVWHIHRSRRDPIFLVEYTVEAAWFGSFKGTNCRQKTYEIFHLYCIFYSSFMCQTTVIFGITKDGSLVLNTLASWSCFTCRNLFQNGANDMSECLTFETAFCKKAQNFV